jgi:hypothetical protein
VQEQDERQSTSSTVKVMGKSDAFYLNNKEYNINVSYPAGMTFQPMSPAAMNSPVATAKCSSLPSTPPQLDCTFSTTSTLVPAEFGLQFLVIAPLSATASDGRRGSDFSLDSIHVKVYNEVCYRAQNDLLANCPDPVDPNAPKPTIKTLQASTPVRVGLLGDLPLWLVVLLGLIIFLVLAVFIWFKYKSYQGNPSSHDSSPADSTGELPEYHNTEARKNQRRSWFQRQAMRARPAPKECSSFQSLNEAKTQGSSQDYTPPTNVPLTTMSDDHKGPSPALNEFTSDDLGSGFYKVSTTRTSTLRTLRESRGRGSNVGTGSRLGAPVKDEILDPERDRSVVSINRKPLLQFSESDVPPPTLSAAQASYTHTTGFISSPTPVSDHVTQVSYVPPPSSVLSYTAPSAIHHSMSSSLRRSRSGRQENFPSPLIKMDDPNDLEPKSMKRSRSALKRNSSRARSTSKHGHSRNSSRNRGGSEIAPPIVPAFSSSINQELKNSFENRNVEELSQSLPLDLTDPRSLAAFGIRPNSPEKDSRIREWASEIASLKQDENSLASNRNSVVSSEGDETPIAFTLQRNPSVASQVRSMHPRIGTPVVDQASVRKDDDELPLARQKSVVSQLALSAVSQGKRSFDTSKRPPLNEMFSGEAEDAEIDDMPLASVVTTISRKKVDDVIDSYL